VAAVAPDQVLAEDPAGPAGRGHIDGDTVGAGVHVRYLVVAAEVHPQPDGAFLQRLLHNLLRDARQDSRESLRGARRIRRGRVRDDPVEQPVPLQRQGGGPGQPLGAQPPVTLGPALQHDRRDAPEAQLARE
jgi:hypothetical protein